MTARDDDAPVPNVVAALSAVMQAVQAVAKSSRNQQQGFSFRGIDAVVNAVGPALRDVGVVIVPVAESITAEQYVTSRGSQMRNVTLRVTFRLYGPAGDHIESTVYGEAADAGDKAVSKAHSVAYRTLLLQALCIPTDEPDPDAAVHERGAHTAQALADLAGAATTEAALRRLWAEAWAGGRLDEPVQVAHREPMSLRAWMTEIGQTLKGAS